MDYFDPYDILCEEQRIKVKFIRNVPWSGTLAIGDDTHSSDSLIVEGTVLQMPLWLARPLIEIGLATALPSRQYGAKVRADLIADPTAVNLKELSPYWYSLGTKISGILPAERTLRLLKGALAGRLGFIGRAVFTPSSGESADPHKTVFGVQGSVAILDNDELEIFSSTFAARKDADAWSSRRNNLLKPLEIYNKLKF